MRSKKKILYIFGTRPEAVKLAPLILASKRAKGLRVEVCVTGQHKEMLSDMLRFFEIRPNYSCNVMSTNQGLASVVSRILQTLSPILKKSKPDVIVVQGDTASAFAGALAAYYYQIKVAHVEAGLRSGNIYSPFPEEMYRRMISRIAEYHFAPTKQARDNLKKEGILKNVWVVGNTVIDALFMALKYVYSSHMLNVFKKKFPFVRSGNKIILVTGHRRESFGTPLRHICDALRGITRAHHDVEIVYPVHLNPNVKNTVRKMLGGQKRIHLIRPLSYPEFIWLMDRAHFIISDSGGVQEEAPSLGKPVLVTRAVTERMEGIRAGCAALVGTDRKKIKQISEKLLRDKEYYKKMARVKNPYGDGAASKKILKELQRAI